MSEGKSVLLKVSSLIWGVDGKHALDLMCNFFCFRLGQSGFKCPTLAFLYAWNSFT